jgi:hypothetical protein
MVVLMHQKMSIVRFIIVQSWLLGSERARRDKSRRLRLLRFKSQLLNAHLRCQLSRERSSAILRKNAAKNAAVKADANTSAVVVAVFPIVWPFQMSAIAPANNVSGRQTAITAPRITITLSRDCSLLVIDSTYSAYVQRTSLKDHFVTRAINLGFLFAGGQERFSLVRRNLFGHRSFSTLLPLLLFFRPFFRSRFFLRA